jgi:hypothetical protein
MYIGVTDNHMCMQAQVRFRLTGKTVDRNFFMWKSKFERRKAINETQSYMRARMVVGKYPSCQCYEGQRLHSWYAQHLCCKPLHRLGCHHDDQIYQPLIYYVKVSLPVCCTFLLAETGCPCCNLDGTVNGSGTT